MNYFLHYNNSEPLFVGGRIHGQNHRVPLAYEAWKVATLPKIDYKYRSDSLALTPSPAEPPHIQTELYRQQWICSNGRDFRIFVHEYLTPDAAFMLLLSTCGADPELRRRIAELEAENRTLKSLIAMLTQNA